MQERQSRCSSLPLADSRLQWWLHLTARTALAGTGSRGVGVFVCVWEGVTHSDYAQGSPNPKHSLECFEPSENCRLLDSPGGVNDTESLLLIQQVHSTPTGYMDVFVSHPKPLWYFSTLFHPVCIICPCVCVVWGQHCAMSGRFGKLRISNLSACCPLLSICRHHLSFTVADNNIQRCHSKVHPSSIA